MGSACSDIGQADIHCALHRRVWEHCKFLCTRACLRATSFFRLCSDRTWLPQVHENRSVSRPGHCRCSGWIGIAQAAKFLHAACCPWKTVSDCMNCIRSLTGGNMGIMTSCQAQHRMLGGCQWLHCMPRPNKRNKRLQQQVQSTGGNPHVQTKAAHAVGCQHDSAVQYLVVGRNALPACHDPPSKQRQCLRFLVISFLCSC